MNREQSPRHLCALVNPLLAYLKRNHKCYELMNVPQLRTCSCKTPISVVAVGQSDNTRPWCGRSRRPTDSRRSDRLEPCRTVTVDQGGLLENHPTSYRSQCSSCSTGVIWLYRRASDTKRAATFWTDCSRLIRPSCSNAGDTKWTPGPASLRPQLTLIWWVVGAAVAGNSHMWTWQPSVQDP